MKKKSDRADILERILTKVVSMDSYMREQMVTRREFRDTVSQIYDHIDGFVKLHTVLDTEVASLRHSNDNLSHRVVRIEKKLGLESA